MPKESGKTISCRQERARICTNLGGKSPLPAQSPSTISTLSETRWASEPRTSEHRWHAAAPPLFRIKFPYYFFLRKGINSIWSVPSISETFRNAPEFFGSDGCDHAADSQAPAKKNSKLPVKCNISTETNGKYSLWQLYFVILLRFSNPSKPQPLFTPKHTAKTKLHPCPTCQWNTLQIDYFFYKNCSSSSHYAEN